VERRAALKSLVNDLQRARTALPGDTSGVPDDIASSVVTLNEDLTAQISTVRDELDDIPEWDTSLVKDLVLDHVGNHGTVHERVDGEVVLRFTVRGSLGNEVDCRYAVGVTNGNECFHVDVDGDWKEVWSN